MIILSETGCRSSPFNLFSPNYVKFNFFYAGRLVWLGQRYRLLADRVEVLVDGGEAQELAEQLIPLADDDYLWASDLTRPGGTDVTFR